MLKNIYLEIKQKFETAIGVLRKEKITIDPDDTAAVNQYAKVMKTVREKYVSVVISGLCWVIHELNVMIVYVSFCFFVFFDLHINPISL